MRSSIMLIGIPGSGKSSLAQNLVVLEPSYRIVATDRIRAQLYGNEMIQGNWVEIFQQVQAQIDQHLQAGYAIIYDATNVVSSWRTDFLASVQKHNLTWIGVHLQTPLAVCLQRNQQRDRTIPDSVIIEMDQALQQSPPHLHEGFSAIYRWDAGDLERIQLWLKTLSSI